MVHSKISGADTIIAVRESLGVHVCFHVLFSTRTSLERDHGRLLHATLTPGAAEKARKLGDQRVNLCGCGVDGAHEAGRSNRFFFQTSQTPRERERERCMNPHEQVPLQLCAHRCSDRARTSIDGLYGAEAGGALRAPRRVRRRAHLRAGGHGLPTGPGRGRG